MFGSWELASCSPCRSRYGPIGSSASQRFAECRSIWSRFAGRSLCRLSLRCGPRRPLCFYRFGPGGQRQASVILFNRSHRYSRISHSAITAKREPRRASPLLWIASEAGYCLPSSILMPSGLAKSFASNGSCSYATYQKISRLFPCCRATAQGRSGVPVVNRSSCESPTSEV